MNIRASLYALLAIGSLLSCQLLEAIHNPVLSTAKTSAHFNNVFEKIKQHGTVDFVANAKTRFAGVSKSPTFKERISTLKQHKAAQRVSRSAFQPGIDCKIPLVLIPQDTVIIDQPGYYILDCQNLDYEVNPIGFVPAIQIVSEDVTVDLNGLTIKQADPTIPFGYAIQIGYGYFPQTIEEQNFVAKNVTIKNGTIKQFTGNGILAFNNTFGTLFGDPATTELPFEDIQLRNLNVLECGLVTRDINETDLLGIPGISLFAFNEGGSFGASPTYGFKNIAVETVHVNDNAGPASAAFLINTGENVTINNSTANNTIANEFDDPGFPIPYSVAAFYVQGKNIQLFKCQGNGTQDLHAGVFSEGSQIGSFFQRSFDVYLRECQFNDTFGENSAIINVNPSNTTGWLAENCQFNNNRGGLKAGIVVGVHLSDTAPQVVTANGMKWVNCQFNNHSVNPNSLQGSFVAGYVAITATNVEFVDCQSCNIRAESPSHWAHGLLNAVVATDPLFPFGNVTSTIFKNCTVSNISSNRAVFGLGSGYGSGNRSRQALNSNLVVDNCTIENLRSFSIDPVDKIAGIMQVDLVVSEDLPDVNVLPLVNNVLIKNSRVSDVLHQPAGNSNGTPNSNSAGILLESAQNPTLLNNSVANCDKGILLTGKTGIVPNAFQLATTEGDAFAQPPVPINIGTSRVLTITVPGVATTLPANYTYRGPRLNTALTAHIEVADPTGACEPLANKLNGKIGILIADGACPSAEAIERVEAAGAIATIIINNGNQASPVFTGSRNQTKPAMTISAAAGQALLDAIAQDPTLEVTITPYFPAFENVTRGNQTIVDLVNAPRDLLYPVGDLNALGWQVGDLIKFNAHGAIIPGLVDGGTSFLIVYTPGFTENGLVQDNKIQKNRVSGIEDAKSPCTSSLFVSNNAFLQWARTCGQLSY